MSIQISIETTERCQAVNITREVIQALGETGVKEGLVTVFVPHTTAGITIQENADPDVVRDLYERLTALAPADLPYHHFEGNADAHIKATLTGSSVTVLVERGVLQLGRWQGIFLCEFDGPRSRKVWLKAVGTGVV